MQTASGPWGALAFQHDSVGNQSSKALTIGGSTTTEIYTYPVSSNVISGVDIGGVVTRTFTHDLAGNMTQDLRGADLYGFTYNHAGRMATASRNGALEATYTYTADNQLAIRAVVGANPIHYVHDRQGNILAEIDGTTGTTLREYIWLPDDEIAPTRETSGTPAVRPLAVVDTSGGSSSLYMIHLDHLNRPVMMTDALKAQVWNATFLPFGGLHAVTGPATLDARLPGQWFQLETGHAYNWHRQYDPSIGRYTQADPLGFPDGPSRYACAMNSPLIYVDKDGLKVFICRRKTQFDGLLGGIANKFATHYWITTSTKEIGMGPARGSVPGTTSSRPDYPYSTKTGAVDHSGQAGQDGSICEEQHNIDEQCLNNKLIPNMPTGPFIPFMNDCQSFAYGIVNSCRVGPQSSK